jgi:Mrp family chromosome partitioning ATPase
VVLSGRDDEGRTTVSGNLAVALAEAGQEVWLAGAAESHEELRRVLFAAQKRTPPRPRPVKVSEGDAATETRMNGSGVPGVTRLPLKPAAGQRTDDPEATLIMEAPGATPVLAPPVPVTSTMAEVDLDSRWPLVVLIGEGVVRLCSLGEQPDHGVVVVDAPQSDTDERGVRAAQSGVAVLVVARDRTRNRELTRLVDRLRSAGAQAVGFVLTGGRGA